MKKVKETLYEKFTEEDADVVKSMGIGAKLMYYRFFRIGMENFYIMHISGDTFALKDDIKHYGFKWSDIDHAWKSKVSLPKEMWLATLPKMFEKLENKGAAIQHHGKISQYDKDFDRDFGVPGWDHWEFPKIPDGNGAKVYIKVWDHHAPMVGIMGKGSYLIRAVLRYDGFIFTTDKHMWTHVYLKENVDDLIEYLSKYNYTIIDGRIKTGTIQTTRVLEKFSDTSDSVKDLGIGTGSFFKHEYQKIGTMDLKQLKKYFNVKKYNIGHEDTQMAICLIAADIVKGISKKETVPNAFQDSYKFWKTTYEGSALYKGRLPSPHYAMHIIQDILKKKYNIEWDAQKIYEKFSEEGDPVKDMGIGIAKVIINKFKEVMRLNLEEEGELQLDEICLDTMVVVFKSNYPSWREDNLKKYFYDTFKEVGLDKFFLKNDLSGSFYTHDIWWSIRFKEKYDLIFTDEVVITPRNYNEVS